MSKNLVARFQFPHHTAPGEAEAECAFLQQNGIVDAVMSQDVDAIMFGSTLTLRDWSKEGTKGNKTPTHVNAFTSVRIKEDFGLNPSGMILVALLSGGDYHDGVTGFGPGLSCQIARAGFGDELITAIREGNDQDLRDWRERLQYELETNESGYFAKRHKTVRIPETFPDRTILAYYLTPAISEEKELKKFEARWLQWWDKEINIKELREYTAMTFDWLYKGGARKYIRCIAQPLFQHRLKRQQVCAENFSMADITEKRKHFTTDGIPELRLGVTPTTVVRIDLDAEEENPESAEVDLDEEVDVDGLEMTVRETSADLGDEPSSPSKRKRRPPWDPYKPEKWWIPEALLKCGMPNIVKEWQEEQLKIRADPLKFATRKCKPTTKASTGKKIDDSMKDGALEVFLPASKLVKVHVPPRAKKPLERAKTDTALLQSSQQRDVATFFKPSKTTKPALFQIASPSSRKSEGLGQPSEHSSDDELDVGILDLLRKPSNPPQPWLVRSREKSPLIDTALSPAITQRKKKPQKIMNEMEDEIVYVGSKPLQSPSSITSEPTDRHQFRLGNELSRHIVEPANPLEFWKGKNTCQNADATPVVDQSVFGHGVSGHGNHTGTSQEASVDACRQLTKDGQDQPLSLCQPELVKPRRNSAIRRTAILRESLPGTWKEFPLTPSQTSGVAFIDLTNT